MRVFLLLAGLAVGVVSCGSAPSAVEQAPPKAPAAAPVAEQPAPAKDPMAAPVVSGTGLEGLTEVFVDAQMVGSADWNKIVGIDPKQFKVEVETRVRGIPGLKVASDRSANVPRLLVYVQGHTIPGFPGDDPPAAAHMRLVLLQPVILARRGPAGQAILTTGGCAETTIFSTGKASTMNERVKSKVTHLLDGFAGDYAKANPPAG